MKSSPDSFPLAMPQSFACVFDYTPNLFMAEKQFQVPYSSPRPQQRKHFQFLLKDKWLISQDSC